MLPVEAEDALAELVALGMVNSDSFAGLRVLLMPSGRRGKSTSYAATAQAAAGLVRDGGCGALGSGAAARSGRCASRRRGGGANRALAVAPLGSDFLEAPRPGGRLAAAVARYTDVLPPLGGAR